jgi:ribonucleoside-diphosphate reductase alpha chain
LKHRANWRERSSYSSYEGSLWSQGIFPLDSLDILVAQRGEKYINVNRDKTLDWDSLKAKVAAAGMRNSNVMAIAPTATIANITGVSQSIEPTYQNLYVKSNLSGEFTVVNPYLVNDLKSRDLVGQSHGERSEVLRWQRANHRSYPGRSERRNMPPHLR